MNFFARLFSCSHETTTFPQSPRGFHATSLTRIVCLNCGKEFHYDWNKMRMFEAAPQKSIDWEEIREL